MFDTRLRVRQHHALRLAGGARRVDDRREIVGGNRPRVVAKAARRRPTRRSSGRARAVRPRRATAPTASRRGVPAGGPSRPPLRARAAGDAPPASFRAADASTRPPDARRSPGGCSAPAPPTASDKSAPSRRRRSGSRDRTAAIPAGSPRQSRRDRPATCPAHESRATDRECARRPPCWTVRRRFRPRQRPSVTGFGKPAHHVERQVGDRVDVGFDLGFRGGPMGHGGRVTSNAGRLKVDTIEPL